MMQRHDTDANRLTIFRELSRYFEIERGSQLLFVFEDSHEEAGSPAGRRNKREA